MKKISALLLAAGMVVAASAPANAVDVKVDARYRFSFMTGQSGFNGANQESFLQRLRLGLTMAASENLSGYVQFQIMGDQFGYAKNEAKGIAAMTNAGYPDDLKTRQAYIDWTVPATAVKVRMGRQCLGLPADAFGENAVMASGYGTRDGIVVTAPVTDWLGLTALWTRANHDNSTDLDKNSTDDIYAAVANLKFQGVSASVYAAYATLDENANHVAKQAGATLPNFEGDAYWLGFTSALTMFDPFTLKLSAAFGEASADDSHAADTKGWNVQAKASYKLGFGTPVFGAWYFSGDDKGEVGRGFMPHVQGAFTPTRTYHDGANGLVGGVGTDMMYGNWGVQAGIEGMSFIDGLTHDFLVTYIQGTNDKDNEGARSDVYLTTEDSFVSFDLISTYKIYKNLAAHLELSYIINDFDGDTVDKDDEPVVLTEDDWRAELTFEYKF